jgi:hypothetical protein
MTDCKVEGRYCPAKKRQTRQLRALASLILYKICCGFYTAQRTAGGEIIL